MVNAHPTTFDAANLLHPNLRVDLNRIGTSRFAGVILLAAFEKKQGRIEMSTFQRQGDVTVTSVKVVHSSYQPVFLVSISTTGGSV